MKQHLFIYYSLQFSIIKWKKEIKLLSGNGENRLNKIRNLKKEKREREKKRRQGCVRVLATSGPPQINYESRERVSIKRER